MPALNPTDSAPRHSTRFAYYFESGEQLARDPAYVGALQRDLYRNGYYCGPIDGIFSPQVALTRSLVCKRIPPCTSPAL